MKETDIPHNALDVASKVSKYLEKRLCSLTEDRADVDRRITYTRIDGVVRNDSIFVLIEVELIEPRLWLETSTGATGFERLCQVVSRSSS